MKFKKLLRDIRKYFSLTVLLLFFIISIVLSSKLRNSLEKAFKNTRSESLTDNSRATINSSLESKFLKNMKLKYTSNNRLLRAHREDLSKEYKDFDDLLIFNCTKKNHFALTWDDGPQDKLTQGILDLLKLKNVKATFFMVAKRLLWEPHAKAARRALKEGHQIASHSWNHENLTKVSFERNCTELKHQVFDSNKLFREKLGVSPKFFRPPYGEITKQVAQSLRLWDFYIPIWNLNTFDWFWKGLDKLKIVKSYTDELKNKGNNFKRKESYVSLQHDISRNVEATIERYSYLIDLIREKGYKLVTMAECIGKEDDMYFKKEINKEELKCMFESEK